MARTNNKRKPNNIIPFSILFKKDNRPQKGWWAPGDYLNHCRLCNDGFIGDKRAGHCADCVYGNKNEK